MAAVLLYDIDEVAQDPVRSLRQRLTRGISVKIACLAALAVKIACLAALAVSSYAAPQVLTVGKLLLPEKSSQWTSKTARARGERGGRGRIRWRRHARVDEDGCGGRRSGGADALHASGAAGEQGGRVSDDLCAEASAALRRCGILCVSCTGTREQCWIEKVEVEVVEVEVEVVEVEKGYRRGGGGG